MILMSLLHRPFIPANDNSEFHLIIIVRWNEWPVGITQPYSEVYWGYIRHLVFF